MHCCATKMEAASLRLVWDYWFSALQKEWHRNFQQLYLMWHINGNMKFLLWVHSFWKKRVNWPSWLTYCVEAKCSTPFLFEKYFTIGNTNELNQWRISILPQIKQNQTGNLDRKMHKVEAMDMWASLSAAWVISRYCGLHPFLYCFTVLVLLK